jgi:hypothetical protein
MVISSEPDGLWLVACGLWLVGYLSIACWGKKIENLETASLITPFKA